MSNSRRTSRSDSETREPGEPGGREHGRLEDGGVTRGWGMFRMRDNGTTTTDQTTVLFLAHYVMDGYEYSI